MNGKKGSFEINIPSVTKAKVPPTGQESGGGTDAGFSCKEWALRVWAFCKEDSNRVLFSFKVGLAVLLVSLLILFRAPYEVFGTNIIWSILTVAIMFEYTVGILAIGVAQMALSSGQVAQPIIIGISIFAIGTVTSFMKLWPSLVPYEYGFRVILFTYCLIIVSGYRMGNPIRTAMDRLYSIAIGGIVAVLVNVLIFPIWAGEQLHKELVSSFGAVADSLEECVRKYLEDEGFDLPEFSKTIMDEFPDEPAYRKCKSTLNSSAKLETLANSAKWEPPHGRFRHVFYPWSEYVKVGAVLRYCTYEVMALHGVLHSEIQAPYNLRVTFRTEIQEATSEAAELLRSLGKDISNMKRSPNTSLLKRLHSSTERLQRAIDTHSYLLTSTYDAAAADNPSKPLSSRLSHAFSSTLRDLSTQLADLDKAAADDDQASPEKLPLPLPLPLPPPQPAETYHEMMRKQSRRLHSWPPRAVDAFEEEGGFAAAAADFNVPRMKALESTASLSLATFTSLLIEFVARLDHLVEAVDELSKMAKFKQVL
ncbi:aluminum-activated malate transporter 9-like isoform X2 [Diospyros lotus]|uniref:aluminum-activated malate transporter 9-like isoform X2 n=1 Tax=Diospyros lotus TaxID=55363 RepID=UPI002250820B|nr:aluminum-activated malate transporter 9-like isoform X2 [Diospyros lotus]